MNVKTLAECPDDIEDCLALIEDSFNYEDQYNYKDDFSLLLDERNHSNCYFIKDHDEVVATLFTLPRTLIYKDAKIDVLFLGGISVSDEKRGAGLFRTLLETILLLNPQYSFYLLWSDLAQLYEKFNFYEFGLMGEVDLSNGSIPKYKKFDEEHSDVLIKGYQNLADKYLIPKRSEHDWLTLLKSESIQIVEDDQKNIYLLNKGMDLQGICHEYHPSDAPPLKGVKNWRMDSALDNKQGTLRYMGFLRLGNLEGLNSFITKTSKGRLSLSAYENGVLEVIFDGEKYELGERDFIQGLWGPGKVEEWQGLVPDILIPGFDSI